MTAISSSPSSPDDFSPCRLANIIFVSLMENGYDKVTKSNRYIIQFIYKFKYFRIKADKIFFEIFSKDLNREALDHIIEYTKDCKTVDEKYAKLDGVFAEVIARIAKQAEPLILSSISSEGILWIKTSLNEIRELVSKKWKLVGVDKNYA
jgi:hypothetical protein